MLEGPKAGLTLFSLHELIVQYGMCPDYLDYVVVNLLNSKYPPNLS